MSPDKLQESAKRGDLSAISSLVQQAFTTAFTTCEVCVNAEMQVDVILWLKLKSDKNLNPQACLNVISRLLDSLKPEKITSVRVSKTSSENSEQQVWNKYLALKQGKFVDNTEAINQTSYAVCGVFALGLVFTLGLIFVIFTYKPSSTPSTSSASTSSSSTRSRTFLGRSQTGYELWG